MEITSESVIKKPKRLTSVVWNHFERIRKADVCYAICVHCNKKLSGSSNSGTTHLRNHLMRCLKRSNVDVSQLLAKRRKKDGHLGLANVAYDEGKRLDSNISHTVSKFDQSPKKDESCKIGNIKFDQERSKSDLARMIILHGYPLTMVEHVGFNAFVKNLHPFFEPVPNTDIEVVCNEVYEIEKGKVFEIMRRHNGRISLAVDMWTSPENCEYLCLTAHYIDEFWGLRKKILNFVSLDSSYTEYMLSEVIFKCLMDWNIVRKLFSMTFDDSFSNDDNVLRIKDWLSQTKPLLCNGLLFDVRCAANVLHSIVQDAMEALGSIIQKIRASIKHIKSSQAAQGKFIEIAEKFGMDTQKNLFVDCPIRWNSTYHMLKAAVKYKEAFSLLQVHDPSYSAALSEMEWGWARTITSFLKLIVEITSGICSHKYPTSNIYFPDICDVHIQLIDWCKSEDAFICSMALKMKSKFDKYWNKCSLALAVAAVLDPRFKMKLVEYYYPHIYDKFALDRIKDVSDGLRELFDAYSVQSASCSLSQGSGLAGSNASDDCEVQNKGFDEIVQETSHSNLCNSSDKSRDRLKGFDKFLNETSQSRTVISDLDKYLEEPVFPRSSDDFNILNWWKVNTARYPILSTVARDVLGIPMSKVAPELAFSTEGRVLDQYRASLNPDTRQALICSHNWLQLELEDSRSSSNHSAISSYVQTS